MVHGVLVGNIVSLIDIGRSDNKGMSEVRRAFNMRKLCYLGETCNIEKII